MASAVNPLAAGARTDAQSAAKASVTAAPSKEMFLQLLVAQIRNQDPLNPADGVQFLSQLAQFSELEQLIGIREILEGATEPTKTPTDTEA
jgi:flagellar basal-body rod modification protein FlgD